MFFLAISKRKKQNLFWNKKDPGENGKDRIVIGEERSRGEPLRRPHK